jgi:diguanylate cyclase (GGDEF)-like protein
MTDISLRAVARGLLRRRDDPYAADDVYLARRIAGLVSILCGLLGLVFVPLDPPTAAIGDAGWAVAGAIVVGAFGGAWRLWDRSQAISWTELYALSYVGLATVVAMTWLAGGGITPYAALYPVISASSALNPPRRSFPFQALCIAASCAPIAFGADARVIVPATLAWAIVSGLIVLGADGLRQQSLALMEQERHSSELARADQLTGLGNRRAFEETLAAELSRVRRTPAPLSVALFDLDGLKEINDRHGHLEGDASLRKVARALQLGVRGSDRAYRWAGDEFAVLFPNTTAAEAAVVAERIRHRTAGSAFTSAGEPVLVSYGVAQLEDGDPETLLAAADVALFEYKTARPPLPN